MLWVTREYVHVDRVACPWLVTRFIDSRAQFIFLPKAEIPDFVQKTGAIPFDTSTGIELDHHTCSGEAHCTFDALIEKYKLESNTALQQMRRIVRLADTDRLNEDPLAFALEAIAVSIPLTVNSDQETLEKEFPTYDALYTYFCQKEIQVEYNKEISKLKTRADKQAFIKTKLAKSKN